MPYLSNRVWGPLKTHVKIKLAGGQDQRRNSHLVGISFPTSMSFQPSPLGSAVHFDPSHLLKSEHLCLGLLIEREGGDYIAGT